MKILYDIVSIYYYIFISYQYNFSIHLYLCSLLYLLHSNNLYCHCINYYITLTFIMILFYIIFYH